VSAEFQIVPEALESIVRQARAVQPVECCGLLIGSGSTVTEAMQIANVSEAPNHFFVDPKGHIDGRRDARRRGLDVLGFYHSHPHTPATPSATDRAEAAYPGLLYLIVSLAADQVEVRLYRFEEDDFTEVTYRARPLTGSGSA
jgi:proteasome lid subunit RPN8/RPN11